ncbi:MAG: LysR substrate-binding domain-containing protein [Gammaproteobacteria bacterium]
MNINYLRSFVRVAETGSVSRAAELLGLSQPALSRQIGLLEQSLGVPLLRRTGRGVEPTPAGEQLRESAYRILEEMTRLQRDILSPSTVAGSLSVGIPPSAAATVAGPLVERFHRHYPAVSLRVVEDLTGAIQDGLMAGALDLGILYQGALNSGLHTEILRSEALVLVGPPGASLTPSVPVPFRELVRYPMVLPGARHGLRTIVEQAAFRAGIQLNTVIEVESLPLLLDFVHRGLGYTVLSREVCQPMLDAGELTAAEIVRPVLQRSWVLAWRKGAVPGSAAAAMARAIQEFFETPPSDGSDA